MSKTMSVLTSTTPKLVSHGHKRSKNSENQRFLLGRLQATLPGPRKLWKGNGTIVGLCLKSPRGTYPELTEALQACTANGPLKYFCMTDVRLPQHLPEVLLEDSQLEVLHFVGPSTKVIIFWQKSPEACECC